MFKILEIFTALSVNTANPAPMPACYTECSVRDTCEFVETDDDPRWESVSEIENTSDEICGTNNECELEY